MAAPGISTREAQSLLRPHDAATDKTTDTLMDKTGGKLGRCLAIAGLISGRCGQRGWTC